MAACLWQTRERATQPRRMLSGHKMAVQWQMRIMADFRGILRWLQRGFLDLFAVNEFS